MNVVKGKQAAAQTQEPPDEILRRLSRTHVWRPPSARPEAPPEPGGPPDAPRETDPAMDKLSGVLAIAAFIGESERRRSICWKAEKFRQGSWGRVGSPPKPDFASFSPSWRGEPCGSTRPRP